MMVSILRIPALGISQCWNCRCEPLHQPFLFYFLDPVSLFPSLECGGMISTLCNLRPLGSSNSPALASLVTWITGVCYHVWLIFGFLVETGFHHVGQADLKLLTSSDLPASAFQSAGITGVSHCAWPRMQFSKFLWTVFLLL